MPLSEVAIVGNTKGAFGSWETMVQVHDNNNDLLDDASDDDNLLLMEVDVDADDTEYSRVMQLESSPKRRKRSMSYRGGGGVDAHPRSPVHVNPHHLDPSPVARVVTPDRQSSFFVCPDIAELQFQIDRSVRRFHESMRRTDETRSIVKMPCSSVVVAADYNGACSIIDQNAFNGMKYREFAEIRQQVYEMLRPTGTAPPLELADCVEYV